MCHPRLSRAFTLIELLVVVSIIALLIAILLPALGSARIATRSAKCLAQQRGFGQSTSAYSADSRGAALPVTLEGLHWTQVAIDYQSDDPNAFMCPEATELGAWATTTNDHGGGHREAWQFRDDPFLTISGEPIRGSYGINIWAQDWRPLVEQGLLANTTVGPFGGDPEKAWGGYLNRMDNGGPFSEIPLMGDASWHNSIPVDTENATVEPGNGGIGAGRIARYAVNRHPADATNLVFMDGHAEPVQHSDLWTVQWHVGFTKRENVSVPW